MATWSSNEAKKGTGKLSMQQLDRWGLPSLHNENNILMRIRFKPINYYHNFVWVCSSKFKESEMYFTYMYFQSEEFSKRKSSNSGHIPSYI